MVYKIKQNMQGPQSAVNISVIWRGKKFVVEMHSGATLKELGHKLLEFANVKADTMRLIVPQYSNKSSKLLSPFSDEHSGLCLQEISILEGKPIRMMGASEVEVDEVLQGARADLRIAGFDEEEKRLKQRMSEGPHASLKLPQGTYIFCDFRTLQIPGIELNPPPSEALKRMHMLAADPGIVAIMNKHRWRVGIMTELAPVGYVGVSPKCILGFNKNHGEEISLRLRTDDLKGFRKYESIKKTLLHELAHMIYSEHDANFYALDKQLNQEAASLDWTRSRSHTLSGVGRLEQYEEEFYVGDSSKFSQKLGGSKADQLASARASSVAAAYHRIASASANSLRSAEVHEEPDPDDSGFNMHEEPDPSDSLGKELNDERANKAQENFDYEPDPDDCLGKQNNCEPDPDDSQGYEMMETEKFVGTNGNRTISEQDFDDIEMTQYEPPPTKNRKFVVTKMSEEPDPDDSEVSPKYGIVAEPDPDDSEVLQKNLDCEHISRPDQGGSPVTETMKNQAPLSNGYIEPDPDDSLAKRLVQAEPDPDLNDNLVRPTGTSGTQTEEPDPDDQELQRIQDPVTVVCSRLQKAIKILRSEVNPTEASNVLQTLFKIIRNVIEHPDEIKFKRLRKANPVIQRNVANYKAAMEILNLIGFIEDVVLDEIGKAETYLVLKRNDPGLLWLAKSSLETCIAY